MDKSKEVVKAFSATWYPLVGATICNWLGLEFSDRRVGQFHIELEGEKVTQALKYLHESKFEVEVH
ncbi:NIL domain-containing protein [Nostoc sp.]|uniref:NIL domain-containing protein n=1 Tax=Nostoc sp. TaxID=1180 RepID=UPI002FF86B42